MIKIKHYFLEPPVDCSWGDWSEYSACSVTCGGAGTQTRTRSKAVEASGGGFDCAGPTEETTSCNNGECGGKCLDNYSANRALELMCRKSSCMPNMTS